MTYDQAKAAAFRDLGRELKKHSGVCSLIQSRVNQLLHLRNDPPVGTVGEAWTGDLAELDVPSKLLFRAAVVDVSEYHDGDAMLVWSDDLDLTEGKATVDAVHAAEDPDLWAAFIRPCRACGRPSPVTPTFRLDEKAADDRKVVEAIEIASTWPDHVCAGRG